MGDQMISPSDGTDGIRAPSSNTEVPDARANDTDRAAGEIINKIVNDTVSARKKAKVSLESDTPSFEGSEAASTKLEDEPRTQILDPSNNEVEDSEGDLALPIPRRAASTMLQLEMRLESRDEKLQMAQAVVGSYRQHSGQMKGQIEQLTLETETLRENIEQRDRRIGQLDQGIGQLKQDMKQRNKDIEQLKQELEDAGSTISNLESQLTRVRGAGTPKVPTELINEKWHQLQYAIEGIARDCLTRVCSREELSETTIQDLQKVSEAWEHHLTDQRVRYELLEGFLWRRFASLCLHQRPNNMWMGKSGQRLKLLCGEIMQNVAKDDPEMLERLCHWRANAAEMLEFSKRRSDDQQIDGTLALHRAKRDELTRQTDDLLPFLPHSTSMEELGRLQHQVCKAFDLALELDAIFMESRSHWRIVWLSFRQGESTFDSELMEPAHSNTHPTKRTVIEFLCSPLLRRQGNSDGFDYDEGLVEHPFKTKAVFVQNSKLRLCRNKKRKVAEMEE